MRFVRIAQNVQDHVHEGVVQRVVAFVDVLEALAGEQRGQRRRR